MAEVTTNATVRANDRFHELLKQTWGEGTFPDRVLAVAADKQENRPDAGMTTDLWAGFPAAFAYPADAARLDLTSPSCRRLKTLFRLMGRAGQVEGAMHGAGDSFGDILSGADYVRPIQASKFRARVWTAALHNALYAMLADVAATIALRALAHAGMPAEEGRGHVRAVLAMGDPVHIRAADDKGDAQ